MFSLIDLYSEVSIFSCVTQIEYFLHFVIRLTVFFKACKLRNYFILKKITANYFVF